MFKYLSVAPEKALGMVVLFGLMLWFSIWVRGFRNQVKPLMKNKKTFLMISLVIIVICLGSMMIRGLNFGLDFTGGTVIQLALEPDVKVPQVRDAIKEFAAKSKTPDAFADPRIQLTVDVEQGGGGEEKPSKPQPTAETPVSPSPASSAEAAPSPAASPGEAVSPSPEGTGAVEEKAKAPETAPKAKAKLAQFRVCIIQVKKIDAGEVDSLATFLSSKLGQMELLKVESIGPTIGKELRSRALAALLIALLAQLIYITFRFGSQLRYGIGADIALIHDLIIMVGVYSLFGRPVDSPFVAALLTIIGYSVMDTVVVYDRVRENLKLMKGTSYEDTVNISLNQVMTRSAATSMTTLLTIVAIFFFGGDTLSHFAFALMIGVVSGTYSSMFIASPLIIWMDSYAKSQEQKKVAERRARLETEAKDKAARKDKESAPAKAQASASPAGVEDSESQEDGEDPADKEKRAARKRRR
jgi:preprotein translocase SecF subunit